MPPEERVFCISAPLSTPDENKTLEVLHERFGPQPAVISCRDHHCFSNTVIGWSFRVCLGAEELEQWYGDRWDF